MKAFITLALTGLGSSFVLPDEQVFVALSNEDSTKSPLEKLPSVEHITDTLQHGAELAWNGLTDIGDRVKSSLDFAIESTETKLQGWAETFDVNGWMEPEILEFEEADDDESDHPPHHGPPHHGPPHHGPPHHGRPRHPPHHRHPHHKSNKTVYQLIAESKYTTKLAKLINKYPDIVDILNGTSANFTIFAPTDAAFAKIPEHAPKPSKEFLKTILAYHVSPYFYPAGRVLASDTIPTTYNETKLGGAQRLSVRLSLKGLVVNFYSRIVGANFFGSNGVIHAVDSLLIPPPKAFKILNLLPGEFSTLLLALEKTGLGEKLNSTSGHVGGTLFAPGNFAFKKLGPGPNAFLFSEHGLPYLKALLKYHIVANQTVYSDAFYNIKTEDVAEEEEADDDADADATSSPRRYIHLELQTLLKDHKVPVDITRWGPFITFKVNGFSRVTVKNGAAKDGVIQVVSDVLIPPKKVGGGELQHWAGAEMSVDELKQHLAPLVAEDAQSEPANQAGGIRWEM